MGNYCMNFNRPVNFLNRVNHELSMNFYNRKNQEFELGNILFFWNWGKNWKLCVNFYWDLCVNFYNWGIQELCVKTCCYCSFFN